MMVLVLFFSCAKCFHIAFSKGVCEVWGSLALVVAEHQKRDSPCSKRLKVTFSSTGLQMQLTTICK